MLLALDIGNTQLFGGVFDKGTILLRFRRTSRDYASSDEYGLFLRHTLRENGIDPLAVKHIVISSVVPDLNHTVSSACIKYFHLRPLMLEPGVKTGLKLSIANPAELGADRVANAVGAMTLFPGKNLVIFDLGTANTACLISDKKEYLGGLISPGMRLCMEALEAKTAKLPTVEIKIPTTLMGKNTVEQIQAGLYYSTLGLAREFTQFAKNEVFKEAPFLVIGTGGFSRLFEDQGVFNHFEPDLILYGLKHIFELNQGAAIEKF